ncbi:hypothetical protein BDV95DRAFT_611614 [Massariosphaeria phaeospora]|uniref:F-box domain-containing protein n=1 Tax=Massariosphaeria phaeospora TaxID=100035 RepID=A0A7C8M8I1_9PLEO|nr:hypothetical protein BDV95DRAFT_611614 [Massariosphaeria phaeospora]
MPIIKEYWIASMDSPLPDIRHLHVQPPNRIPFLSLPKPVRLRIYSYLAPRTIHTVGHQEPAASKAVIILVLRFVDRAILRTCRTIRDEAEATLEIETMKLGPPQLIVASEHFQTVPAFLYMLRQQQDQHVWQRLRLRDEDRVDLDREDIGLLMWIRLANLYLQSAKRMQIGLFISPYTSTRRLLMTLAHDAAAIARPRWGDDLSDCCHPSFEVVFETPAFAFGSEEVLDEAAYVLEGEKGFSVVRGIDAAARLRDWGVEGFGWALDARETEGGWTWVESARAQEVGSACQSDD